MYVQTELTKSVLCWNIYNYIICTNRTYKVRSSLELICTNGSHKVRSSLELVCTNVNHKVSSLLELISPRAPHSHLVPPIVDFMSFSHKSDHQYASTVLNLLPSPWQLSPSSTMFCQLILYENVCMCACWGNKKKGGGGGAILIIV